MLSYSAVQPLLRQAAGILRASSREGTRDAALLLCHVLGRSRAWLLANPDAVLTAEQQAAFAALLARRAQHEPMQYILGEQEFYGLRFRVTPDVLIPRPETEHLVEAVLTRLPHAAPTRIADVGTGSGAIAVALAHALPLAQVDAIDLSPAALRIARENAAAHGVEARVCCIEADLLAASAGERYHCIVSNPPYVQESETLDREVAAWEPRGALFAGTDGLAVYRRLIPAASGHLVPGGLLALEIGYGQQRAIDELFRADTRWVQPRFLHDLRGIARVALALAAEVAEG